MAFLYGLLRAVAAAMRLVASARHRRAKARYEQLEKNFHDLEHNCKAHEVRVGEPASYKAQLELLRAFEAKDRARIRWINAANKLERRKRREQWLKDFSGRKLPYTFGIVDTALILHAIDRIGGSYGLDVPGLVESLTSLL